MVFDVMAETHEGKVMALRRGFASAEDAEAHPVRLKHWKRVWVARAVKAAAAEYVHPPFPWTVEWIAGFAYVLAADGRKIASLLGPQQQREYVAETLAAIRAIGKEG